MASAHLLTAMRCTSTRFRSSNPFCVRSVGRRAYLVPQTCSFEVTMLWCCRHIYGSQANLFVALFATQAVQFSECKDPPQTSA